MIMMNKSVSAKHSIHELASLLVTTIALVVIAMPFGALAQQPTTVEMTDQFDSRCAVCHDAQEKTRAPPRQTLAQFSPERVLAAIATGPMAPYADGLSSDAKRVLAEFVSGKPFGGSRSRSAAAMPNQCTKPLRMRDPFAQPFWNGWSPDATKQWRFQNAAAAGLSANELPKLRLKWAFGIPGAGAAAWSPITVVGQTLFVGADNNFVYALDARTGCVHWSFEAKRAIRSAVVIGEINDKRGTRYGAFFGDQGANVYGLDAESGRLLWAARADEHGSARVTASPVIDQAHSRVIVAVSSWEEISGQSLDYPCCTFQGSLAAFDLSTGKQAWKSYTLTQRPHPIRRNSAGIQLYGPAGASVWAAPTIDPKRNLVYAATGNAYIDFPDEGSTDAVIAFDLTSGERKWSHQVLAGDAWYGGCGRSPEERRVNCPGKFDSPNDDISSPPILHDLPDGRTLLLLSQELGRIVALDPDRQGRRIWLAQAGDKAGINDAGFGGAFDGENFYRPLAYPDRTGALAAIRAADGVRIWYSKLPDPACASESREAAGKGSDAHEPDCQTGNGGAASVIPGIVFTGARDGVMRGYSTADGSVLWEFSAKRSFDTVNRVKANGGSFGGPGPTIVAGMLFTGSGFWNAPGNVLLAFSIE